MGENPATTAPGSGGSRSSSPQLIGRDDDLARLEGLFDDVEAAGRPVPVLLEGPAGIGKTRLVAELRARLQERDVDVLVGHCVAMGGETLPYAPLAEVLTQVVRREGVSTVRGWAGPTGAELGRLVPLLADEDPQPSAAGTGRLFQAFSSLLGSLSSLRPLLLVIEDVHWADVSTRQMLATLARQLRGPVLLVLTVRSDESPVPEGLARYLAELVRSSEARVALMPLSRDEQARQISEITGLPPTRALVDQVYARAEGNPFFAEELLALEEQHCALPASVRDRLAARLEVLRPPTRQVLRTASILGRQVPHRLLEAVVDVHGRRLDEALREAVESHVLEAGTGGLAFRHALLQEAVAGSLLPGEAARTHRRVAVALTKDPTLVADGSRSAAGRLAHHWDAAGEPAEALRASIAAGRESSEALAFAESLRHFERALELLDVVPSGDALVGTPLAELYRTMAEVAALAAEPERATELVRASIAHTDPADETLTGVLHERLGRYLYLAGDPYSARAAYQEAVGLVPASPPTRARAAVLSGLSQILMLADHRYADSAVLAREAIEMARELPDARSVEGQARCNLGVDLAFTGRVDEGIAELHAARRIAEDQLADVDENTRALVNLNRALLFAGRLDEAVAMALESVLVCESTGLRRRWGIWCRCDVAMTLLLLGRYDEAEALLVETRAMEQHGVDAFRVDLAEGQLCSRRGELDHARQLLETARAEGQWIVDPQLVGPLYAALVELALLQDDLDTALELADEGLGRVDVESVHPIYVAGFLAAAARAAARAGRDADLAEAWLDRAQACADRTPETIPEPAAHLATARAEVAGTPAAWTEALQRWQALGDPYRIAYARTELAAAQLATGADRGFAAEHLASAAAAARDLGAAHLLSRCEDLARRARLRVGAAPADNPYRLTSREREILALVAEGLTDRAIGGRLFISHRTVERHVSNLLAKLAADRRSELVATALREGLLAG